MLRKRNCTIVLGEALPSSRSFQYRECYAIHHPRITLFISCQDFPPIPASFFPFSLPPRDTLVDKISHLVIAVVTKPFSNLLVVFSIRHTVSVPSSRHLFPHVEPVVHSTLYHPYLRLPVYSFENALNKQFLEKPVNANGLLLVFFRIILHRLVADW
jgi:hypothetical protein